MERSRTAPAKTVDEYLQSLPNNVRDTLEQLRQSIMTAAPGAEEVISYQIPTYKYKGALVHFAAFPNHLSFFGVSKQIFKTFEKELKPFKIAGTTIHFSADNPLPLTLVKKMVKERVRENEERVATKSKKPARQGSNR